MSADLGAPSVVLFAPTCTCSTHPPSQALPCLLQMSLEAPTPAQPEAGKHLVVGRMGLKGLDLGGISVPLSLM